MSLSRRQFLELSGLALGAAWLPPLPPIEAPRRTQSLGRTTRAVYIYEQPSFRSRSLNLLAADTVINLYDTVEAEDYPHNPFWHQVRRGYVHAGLIQPVRWEFQTPVESIPDAGRLGEITVPFTIARAGPGANFISDRRYHFETTHWIRRTARDADGAIWYGIYGDRTRAYTWVPAAHVRLIEPSEVTPLAPQARSKRIEIGLAGQSFRCFEGDRLVLDTLCSTGIYLRTEQGRRIYGTPAGEWQVIRKRPSRHMAGDDRASADFFDLPGVPWVSYFHWWGVAIHGTYWHNDYGKPHSHGCINLPSETAKWVYRWTTPVVPLDEDEVSERGTQVIVF